MKLKQLNETEETDLVAHIVNDALKDIPNIEITTGPYLVYVNLIDPSLRPFGIRRKSLERSKPAVVFRLHDNILIMSNRIGRILAEFDMADPSFSTEKLKEAFLIAKRTMGKED